MHCSTALGCHGDTRNKCFTDNFHYFQHVISFRDANNVWKMKRIFTINENQHAGAPVKFQWQTGSGNYIALAGSTNSVYIFDRHGESVDEIPLSGQCICLAWDRDGDMLALVNNKTNQVALWDANTRRSELLDCSMGLKDTLSYAVWAKKSSTLAIGNTKGNILLYNHHGSKKVPVIGKHTKKIMCGAFNDKDMLALGAEDQLITVSTPEGDTMYSFSCTGEPSDIRFAEMKETERSSAGESTISAIVGRKNLMLINLNEPQNPMNLQFQARYGSLMQYCWYGDGYILLAFDFGFLVAISTHASEIGQEIFSVQEYKTYMSSATISTSFSKAIAAGDGSVKIRELTQLSEVYAIINLDTEDKRLDRVSTTQDGQLLAISTQSGAVHVYLTRLPVLGDAFRTRVAYLSSLSEVTVANEFEQEKPIAFTVDVEPAFIGVGPMHVAVGMNNRTSFHIFGQDGIRLLCEREYLGTVNSIKLNSDYACALFEGKVHLHAIEQPPSDDRESRVFPDADKSSFKITSVALSTDCLVFSTDGGHLQYFLLDDWKYVNEYRHVVGIKAIYHEAVGTRLIFVDDKLDVFMYNPVNDYMIEIPETKGNIRDVLWENWLVEKDTFVLNDGTTLHTYIFYRDTIEGSKIIRVGETKLGHGYTPLLLHNGQVVCLTQNGRTVTVDLTTRHLDETLQGKPVSELETNLRQLLLLKRWHNAWTVCDTLRLRKYWDMLAQAALTHMDIEFAMRIYRNVGDVGMVWALEDIYHCEDRNLLAGHLAMYLNKFDMAEKLYLQSSSPLCALEMRRDLLHWDNALQLANRLAPSEIPFISKEYAQQLEFTGDYGNALVHYEQGIINDPQAKEHNDACQAGIARMAIRTGDIRRGTRLALESQNRALKKECASILEGMKQYIEAAQLYESGHFYDKAASVFVKAKNWAKVADMLQHVHSPKIHSQYAKAMEAEKKYQLAVDAYKTAKDYDNVVRLLLDHLNNAEEAVKVVRESKSIEGAKLVARFFTKLNDHSTAIQFLVLSQCHQEAYKLAEQHDKMEIYAEAVGTEGNVETYEMMARYFESRRKAYFSGKYYYLAGHYGTALSHLLSNGEDSDSIKLAIECVGVANDDELTRRLMDFLMGDVDGVPKEAKHLFRLYMALKMYREAAKTAVIIAREEQSNGQYRLAHDVLFGMYHELRAQRIKIPYEMEMNLMLIHSYLIVKSLIKRGEDKQAARMLIRVAGNISKFPSHTVQILTSAVIQCSKAGMKNSAFNFAAILMRPEHRKKIDEKYRKKIEQIVRKPEKTEEEESKSPCPHCSTPLPDSELTCANCKNTIPFCIVTGKHMTKDDFGRCLNCKFTGSYTELQKIVSNGEPCPMCGARINQNEIEIVSEPEKYMNQQSTE